MKIEEKDNLITINDSICILKNIKDLNCLKNIESNKTLILNKYDQTVDYTKIIELSKINRFNLVFVNSKEKFPLSFPHPVKEKNTVLEMNNITIKFLYSSLTDINSLLIHNNDILILLSVEKDIKENKLIKELSEKVDLNYIFA